RIPFRQRVASPVSDEQYDALQRLERRVEVLEQVVRRLLASGAAAERITAAPAPPLSPLRPGALSRPPTHPPNRRCPRHHHPRPPTSSNGSASAACWWWACSRCSRRQASS